LQLSSPLVPTVIHARPTNFAHLPVFPYPSPRHHGLDHAISGRDCKLQSSMSTFSDETLSIATAERLHDHESSLRVPVVTVTALESRQARSARCRYYLTQVVNALRSWKTSQNSDWNLRWKPFLLDKKSYIEQEKFEYLADAPVVIELAVDSLYVRSKISDDYDLSDDTPDSSPPPLPVLESLESLVSAHKSLLKPTDYNIKGMPLIPFEFHNNDETVVETRVANEQEKQQLLETRRQNEQATTARLHAAAVAKLDFRFEPAVTILINTATFLTARNELYRDLMTCTHGMVAVERDYGLDEPDVLLSCRTGVLVFSFAEIIQLSAGNVNMSLARARRVNMRISQLLIMVIVPESVTLDNRTDMQSLTWFITSAAGMTVILVNDSNGTARVVERMASLVREFATAGDGIAEIETTWERFLRKLGMNGYAAQQVLKRAQSLDRFVCCQPSERTEMFADLVGDRVLQRVSQVLQAKL
ncbi:hypothetical protein V1514DRAFT_287036, partial [Lipomyces japonicus]|uniref:uncharacterized protein n=1 Tax=Lipomyces japonicus TaxID=56871 RepID=UPI0034CD2278